MTITYTEITNSQGQTVIQRDNGDGTITSIPCDPTNSDYQAYLNKDKPQVEHLTEIPTVTE